MKSTERHTLEASKLKILLHAEQRFIIILVVSNTTAIADANCGEF
jgi:hypothetical protein